MAIYHCSMKPVSRASGRSAVAAAAYRAGEQLTNERDGQVHDFTRRGGVEHTEKVLPQNANAEWAKDRSALWNAAEAAEKRKDARVAREFEIALPHELDAGQRVAAAREFAQHLADRYGVAVDVAIHAPHGKTDERNHHAHLLMTTRQVGPDGLGDKSHLERENKWLLSRALPTSQMQLKGLRSDWGSIANRHLARAGHDIRIDHRSHADRGLDIAPTEHMGVHATQMERRGLDVSRTKLDPAMARSNAEVVRRQPEQVLRIITDEKSVFNRRDVARTLHRYIDEPEAFSAAFAQIMGSSQLVELVAEQRVETAPGKRVVEPARYTTRALLDVERAMSLGADRLSGTTHAQVSSRHLASVLRKQDFLSEEQRAAVTHLTTGSDIAVAVGLAGAGKSTMLNAARQVWAQGGHTVYGAALSGKAADGLQQASGIKSRTLASWSYGLDKGALSLKRGDVLVIDEAGMVASPMLSRFITRVEQAGAKVVLVGDPEQLQPIGPGAAFRAVAEQVGFVSLNAVRRQRTGWQREASVALGQQRTQVGLSAYIDRGAVQLHEDTAQAMSGLVSAVLADREVNPASSRLVLAHRRVDVRQLNESIRLALQVRGSLGGLSSDPENPTEKSSDDSSAQHTYVTTQGKRDFVAGDRLIFLQNDAGLDVKNGSLGTVVAASRDQLVVRPDSVDGEANSASRLVTIRVSEYAAFDHGYATTIHKAQGATVDRAFVLGSKTMDRHLTYVALTRHREAVQVHAGRDVFADMDALKQRLSRANSKETTLDYALGTAVRSSDRLDGTQDRGQQLFLARRGIDAVDAAVASVSRSVKTLVQRAEQLLGHPVGQRFERFKEAQAQQRQANIEQTKSNARETYQKVRTERQVKARREAQRERSLQRSRGRSR